MALENAAEMTPEEAAAITADALADPDNPPADDLMSRAGTFRPGSFGCHEALHTASILMDMVDLKLAQHPAIAAKPEWQELAEAAHRALFDLYQAIGAEHLEEDDDARRLSDGEDTTQIT